MQTYSYSSRNPLAAHNPLCFLPLFAPIPACLRPARTPLDLALWELDRAMPDIASAEKQYAYARQSLGDASRNVVAASGRSSMRLEPETWEALREICQREQVDLAGLVQRVEGEGAPGSRTSAIRVFALGYFKAAATEEGHAAAGHGGLA